MVDKLEACPFCGGQARVDIGKNAFEDVEVSCDACGTQGPNCDDGFGREDNQRLAVAAWNTRATPANGEQVERKEEDEEVAFKRDIAEKVRNYFAATPTEDARERVKVLEEALRPFVDLRAQRGAWGIISNALDGLAALTVTVTKAQMLAACDALGNKETDRHG